ncbi:MAG TPA: hypothetical protein VF277_06115, partial [Steroidobacteraceae bacterium]
MNSTAASAPPQHRSPPADADWGPLATCVSLAPAALVPWLAEPGLLTARVRAAAGDATQFHMLRLERAPVLP